MKLAIAYILFVVHPVIYHSDRPELSYCFIQRSNSLERLIAHLLDHFARMTTVGGFNQ